MNVSKSPNWNPGGGRWKYEKDPTREMDRKQDSMIKINSTDI